jgi:hypothetical protein
MAKSYSEVTEKIREEFLDELDELKKKKSTENLTDNDLDYFLARDRKAALILKTLQMDIQYEQLGLKRGPARKALK